MPEIQTPEWVKDAIFYQIFPDRFARSDAVPKARGLQPWGAPPTSHGYQGGDLRHQSSNTGETRSTSCAGFPHRSIGRRNDEGRMTNDQ